MGNEAAPELQQASPSGHIDDLFDYDVGLDDIIQDVSTVPNTNAPEQLSAPDGSGLGLGLDEEVKVSKKRQPVAKLDEGRLLSQRGIPKLRHASKTKLRFKGKGHEFSDAARLLNFYQLWLDDLFPRAKFADGLSMIEKLGHSKRLQIMRREWIDEEKLKLPASTFDDTLPERNQGAQQPSTDSSRTHFSRIDTGAEPSHTDLAAQEKDKEQNGMDQGLFMSDEEGGQPGADNPKPEDDDDLDILLREQEDGGLMTNKDSTVPEPSDDGGYDDDLEALRELEDPGPTST